MKPMRLTLPIVLGILVPPFALSGCGDDPEAPTLPKVILNLTVSNETVFLGQTFTAEAVVQKRWGASVRYSQDCCGGAALIEIRNAFGVPVASNACEALCPGRIAELGDQPLVSDLAFDGKVWQNGEVDISPGVYTVVARFWYESETLEVSRDVNWYAAGRLSAGP
jgi:hypothetical protein